MAHSSYRLVSLAECEAKRRIIELHHPSETEGFVVCSECGPTEDVKWRVEQYLGGLGFPCKTLRLLAIPYADHPDFREEEWRT